MILSSTAKEGEVVVAAADMDGKPHPKFSINFDSTSFKDRKTLLTQLGAMRELGESGLVKAGKDISNPGLLGTLGMLLETSNVGAVVDMDCDSRSEWPRPGKLAEDVSRNGLCGHHKAGKCRESSRSLPEARPDCGGNRPGDKRTKARHSLGKRREQCSSISKRSA